MNKYKKALYFLRVGCGYSCSPKLPKEEFTKLQEDFQALTKPKQDIFLIAQLKTMDRVLLKTKIYTITLDPTI